jgi:hypothetical protein
MEGFAIWIKGTRKARNIEGDGKYLKVTKWHQGCSWGFEGQVVFLQL